MKHLLTVLALCLVILVMAAPSSGHTLNLKTGSYIVLDDLLDDLESVQVVLIGELHDTEAHHTAQLDLIRALHKRGKKIAVALEMFRADGQSVLNDWSQGLLEEGVFKTIYQRHWSMWPLYRPIFDFAMRSRIPLIGLNIDREITRQISNRGFDSLSSKQMEQLEGVSCDVNQPYRNYIRKALGEHLRQQENFRFFCEAQLVWDTMMAQQLLHWRANHPDTLIIVLAGSAHVWRYGIPEQLARRSELTYRILLPEVRGRSDLQHTTAAEADYLLLGLEQGRLH